MAMKTGDMLFFKGNGLFSKLIMAAPGAEFSHVAMYVDHPEYGPCVFESTSLGALDDVITGEKIDGVQLVPFEERVNSYDGEVFHQSLDNELTHEQITEIFDFIDQYHGTPYEEDKLQLARAELDSFPWHKNEEDASSLFCSETIVLCLRSASVVETSDLPSNEFTPTDCSELMNSNIEML